MEEIKAKTDIGKIYKQNNGKGSIKKKRELKKKCIRIERKTYKNVFRISTEKEQKGLFSEELVKEYGR